MVKLPFLIEDVYIWSIDSVGGQLVCLRPLCGKQTVGPSLCELATQRRLPSITVSWSRILNLDPLH